MRRNTSGGFSSRPTWPEGTKSPRVTYVYNADCDCVWCANGGVVPKGTGDNGHSFGYESPHIPPTVSPWSR